MEDRKMYQIGDYIVKPMNGVCKVADIVHLDMSMADKDRQYYLLIPLEDASGKIYVPTDASNTAVRKVMSEGEAREFIDEIPKIEATWIDNERKRQEKYKEVVKSCDPKALVGIIKMAYIRRRKRMEQGKKNTVVDERYFKMAENHLYSELGFALHKERQEICEMIAETCSSKAAVNEG
jgi:CarD family transcriptional regulator